MKDLAEMNDEDPQDSWVNFFVENDLHNFGSGLRMRITGTDGKTIFESQEDFRKAVAIAPAADLMDTKVMLYKKLLGLFDEYIMAFEIPNLNGHNVNIKLSDLQ